MDVKILGKAVDLANKLNRIFIATADASGLPHIGVGGNSTLESEGVITVSAWFCPGTMANLQVNSKVSLVIWDATTDIGYQLLGETEKIEDDAIMNGHAPEREIPPLPQVERRLHIRVEKIITFKQAPHTDMEL